MSFVKLDDSPMFRKQIESLEEGVEFLREKSHKLYKGCRKYTEGLGEGYDGDIAFASVLEAFGGGHNDPASVAFGGPVMTKFTIALREIGTYKEVLRSQVEHMLSDRLMHFVNIDLHDVKEARKRFDKATFLYDQAREKFLSLKKGTKLDTALVIEEDLHNSRAQFEQARFNLVTALSNIEAKKRFEFLEAVSGTMEAHLRYFKQGYELLQRMGSYINQVLAYAQQSREQSNSEQAILMERMEEYKRQINRESRLHTDGVYVSPNGDGIQAIGRGSHKLIEAVMQSAAKGRVETIRQGYLSKRSSNLRGDWKRRFFVLDSRGMLYYYRKEKSKPSGTGHHVSQRNHVSHRNSSEMSHNLLSRWLSSHYRVGVHDNDRSVTHHTVNLLTSTIKVDADQSDLRFCFRIISPSKNYTLQAESTIDQMDWIEKITGVIASLLTSQTSEQRFPGNFLGGRNHYSASETGTIDSQSNSDQGSSEECISLARGHHKRSSRSSRKKWLSALHEKPIDVLRKVCGNDKCADCDALEPDWASLNLGVLICIECSGVHRNLGVHISKVRSLTLDVKVWEPSVIALFKSLGNAYANSVWEEYLHSGSTTRLSNSPERQAFSVVKPSQYDPISVKEKFIHSKYSEKMFVCKPKQDLHLLSAAHQMWDNVRTNDKKAVYRHIINSEADINAVYGQVSFSTGTSLAKVMVQQDRPPSSCPEDDDYLSAASSSNSLCTDDHNIEECLEGCSLLHLACQTADIGMIELLLQYGAHISAPDSRGQTPLHHCILRHRIEFAKLLLSRGADRRAVDENGKSSLQLAADLGIDDEILLMLVDKQMAYHP